MEKVAAIIALIFISSLHVRAQSRVATPAFPFLEILPDARSVMNGGALTGLNSELPSAFYYNPAQLGNFGVENRISTQIHPVGNKWFVPGINQFSTILAFGYSFEAIPIQMGIGIMNSGFDYGTVTVRTLDESYTKTYKAKDVANSFSVGLQYHAGIKLNVGYTFKNLNSQLYNSDFRGKAHDLGMMISYETIIQNVTGGFSVGYALRNEGKPLTFNSAENIVDSNSEDDSFDPYPYNFLLSSYPLPRNQVLGYGLDLGYQIPIRGRNFELFGLSWSVDATRQQLRFSAEDGGLFSPNPSPLFSNVLRANQDAQTQINRGITFRSFDVLYVGFGKIYGALREYPIQTSGVSLNIVQLMKFIPQSKTISFLKFLTEHFELSFTRSYYRFTESYIETDPVYTSLTVSYKGF